MERFRKKHDEVKNVFKTTDEKGKEKELISYQYSNDIDDVIPIIYDILEEYLKKIENLEKQIQIAQANLSTVVPPPPPDLGSGTSGKLTQSVGTPEQRSSAQSTSLFGRVKKPIKMG